MWGPDVYGLVKYQNGPEERSIASHVEAVVFKKAPPCAPGTAHPSSHWLEESHC